MIELAKYRCPLCFAVYDVWLDDGYPEDIEETRCPFCVPDDDELAPLGSYDPEASSLWSPYEEDDEQHEIAMTPEEIELLQVAEELGVNLQDPNARAILHEMEDDEVDIEARWD